MPEAFYVARGLGVDSPPSGYPGTVVGGDEALDSRDGDTSYVEVLGGHFTDPYVETLALWFEPEGAGVPSGVLADRVYADHEFRRGPGSTPGFAVGFNLLHTIATRLTGFIAGAEPDTYHYTTDTLIADRGTGNALHIAAIDSIVDGSGGWYIAPTSAPLVSYNEARITYLRLRVEWDGVPPLRQRNRDTSRARNRASRQRGIRARGYL
jgi:hypothetical protein